MKASEIYDAARYEALAVREAALSGIDDRAAYYAVLNDVYDAYDATIAAARAAYEATLS